MTGGREKEQRARDNRDEGRSGSNQLKTSASQCWSEPLLLDKVCRVESMMSRPERSAAARGYDLTGSSPSSRLAAAAQWMRALPPQHLIDASGSRAVWPPGTLACLAPWHSGIVPGTLASSSLALWL